jgi:hypothetical protein
MGRSGRGNQGFFSSLLALLEHALVHRSINKIKFEDVKIKMIRLHASKISISSETIVRAIETDEWSCGKNFNSVIEHLGMKGGWNISPHMSVYAHSFSAIQGLKSKIAPQQYQLIVRAMPRMFDGFASGYLERRRLADRIIKFLMQQTTVLNSGALGAIASWP